MGLASSSFADHCRWPSTMLTSGAFSSLDSGLVRWDLLSIPALPILPLVLVLLILFLQLLLWFRHFFLCSPLRTSSANASLITSSLRSNLSAPCGVFLRHSSIRFLHRSECACALLLSLIALQPGHPVVAPNSSMSCLVILSL